MRTFCAVIILIFGLLEARAATITADQFVGGGAGLTGIASGGAALTATNIAWTGTNRFSKPIEAGLGLVGTNAAGSNSVYMNTAYSTRFWYDDSASQFNFLDPITGDASGMTALNGSQVTSGTVPAARIADLGATYLKLAATNSAGFTNDARVHAINLGSSTNLPESGVTGLTADLASKASTNWYQGTANQVVLTGTVLSAPQNQDLNAVVQYLSLQVSNLMATNSFIVGKLAAVTAGDLGQLWGTNTANALMKWAQTNSTAEIDFGYAPNIVDFRSGGSSQASINTSGKVTANSFSVANGNTYASGTRGGHSFVLDGSVQWANNSANGFTAMRFGPISGTWPTLYFATNVTGPLTTMSGTLQVTNGVASLRSNLVSVASTGQTITVGASPFNWTNTLNGNCFVFVDGVSVTGTTSINGGVVFNTIGQNTIPLQPNEWVTITYTLGTPTATFKPF